MKPPRMAEEKRRAIIEAFIQNYIRNKLFVGIDLSDEISPAEIAMLKDRTCQAREEMDILCQCKKEQG